MSLILLIIVIVVCLLLEGFFSGSELALVVADKVRLKNKAEQGDKDAETTQRLVSNPRRLFSTTLFGTNLCVVAASTILTYFIISNYGEEYSVFAILLSPVILVFGEVVPKSIYQHHADFLAKRIGVFIVWMSYIFMPFVWVLSKLTEFLIGSVKQVAGLEPRISREELAQMLSSKEVRGSDMPPEERKMIRRVLDLSDDEVQNIMIPLAELEMLPVTADIDAALAIFDLKGLSRLPLFEHRSHNIVGIVDSNDCIFAAQNKPLREIMKKVIYVPETMPLYELYESLQDEKQEIAVVVDEYGAATGFVTLEDLLEEIVGEIRDEYEFEEQHFRVLGEYHFLIIGRMEIEEANEKLRLDIPEGDYETIAGYLLELFSYIPDEGEEINDENWRYKIKTATQRAIVEIEVTKREES